MKKLYECSENYAKSKLWNIRKDIVLNSIYFDDYKNRYGYDTRMICSFFDGFLRYVEELMIENKQNIHPSYFYDLLPLYDNKKTLWNWYCCYDEIGF